MAVRDSNSEMTSNMRPRQGVYYKEKRATRPPSVRTKN